ncbi:MAG: 50S ribosomal protein L30 [Chloroflexota bacterium]
MSRLRITWIKSANGYREYQKRTIKALGLRRLNDTMEHEDSAAIKGMIARVNHLLKVEVI